MDKYSEGTYRPTYVRCRIVYNWMELEIIVKTSFMSCLLAIVTQREGKTSLCLRLHHQCYLQACSPLLCCLWEGVEGKLLLQSSSITPFHSPPSVYDTSQSHAVDPSQALASASTAVLPAACSHTQWISRSRKTCISCARQDRRCIAFHINISKKFVE